MLKNLKAKKTAYMKRWEISAETWKLEKELNGNARNKNTISKMKNCLYCLNSRLDTNEKVFCKLKDKDSFSTEGQREEEQGELNSTGKQCQII